MMALNEKELLEKVNSIFVVSYTFTRVFQIQLSNNYLVEKMKLAYFNFFPLFRFH